MNVLVVDDERAIRNSLKEILTDEGYDVDTAEDGVQAVEKAGKQKFDEFAAVNVVADFKDCVVALPFDNGTGKKPIAQGTCVFVVL